MNLLATTNQPLTMSSLDFLNKIINPARVESGESEVRNNVFIARVLDECDDLLTYKKIVRGNEVTMADLNPDQMMLVGMRESKSVRKSVLKKIKEFGNSDEPKRQQIPQTYAEALQLAADQAKQLELQAPKVAFVDNLVDRTNLLTATQIGQKHKLSAIKLNKILTELNVYNGNVKRGKVFKQWFIDKGYGEMKKTELGYDQPLFTNAGEIWINEQLHSEGIV